MALSLVYQPIFDLDTDRVHGVEALARQSRTPQTPASVWLTQAQLMGFGTDLELAIVRHALADLPLVPAALSVSINLSATAVIDPRLEALLRTVGLDACRLILDVAADGRTEWPALEGPVAALRRMGVRIAVDDAVLCELPGLLPDVIKLNPSIVRSIDTDPTLQALASSIMTLAHDLHAAVCAQAIETVDELRYLRDLGVQRGQGFHLGRPARLPWTIGALVHPAAGAILS